MNTIKINNLLGVLTLTRKPEEDVGKEFAELSLINVRRGASSIMRKLQIPKILFSRIIRLKVIGDQIFIFTMDDAYRSEIDLTNGTLNAWTKVPRIDGSYSMTERAGVISDIDLCWSSNQYYLSTLGQGIYTAGRSNPNLIFTEITKVGLSGYQGFLMVDLDDRTECKQLYAGAFGAGGYYKLALNP